MKISSSFALYFITLSAVTVFAAPPAPEVPSGACAGVLTKSSSISYPVSDSQVQNNEYLGVPHATMYIDFDNSLAYLDVALETATDQFSDGDLSAIEIFEEFDGGAATVSISETIPYALDVNISYTNSEDGGAEDLPMLFVPTNGGTTFFVMLPEDPYKGVCQQI